jgi:hypothetical protein
MKGRTGAELATVFRKYELRFEEADSRVSDWEFVSSGLPVSGGNSARTLSDNLPH